MRGAVLEGEADTLHAAKDPTPRTGVELREGADREKLGEPPVRRDQEGPPVLDLGELGAYGPEEKVPEAGRGSVVEDRSLHAPERRGPADLLDDRFRDRAPQGVELRRGESHGLGRLHGPRDRAGDASLEGADTATDLPGERPSRRREVRFGLVPHAVASDLNDLHPATREDPSPSLKAW